MRGLEGKTLGKYELVREIGHGSMGTVYLGRDLFAHADVAVKVATPRPEDNERSARRRHKLFFNEARAAGRLRHPNIVATIDAGVESELNFIVMEYVPGAQTLDAYCREGNLLPFEQVVDYLLKCAIALDYAHHNGVVHRDIKPRNILLSQDREVKLADFGIALVTAEDAEQTQVVGRIGSPRYMAPEQITGGEITGQSDIFSLGVVLYELLTGVSPFHANSMHAIARNIVREPHRPVRQQRPEVPQALAHIVDRTLKKHPAGRYRTAMDLAGDLSLVYDELQIAGRSAVAEQRLARARALAFFAGFEEAEVREALAAGAWLEFPDGAEILAEGEPGEDFYVLISGEVEVRRGATVVDCLSAGASFGEIGFLLRGGARTATICARGEVVVLKLRASLLERTSIACQLNFYRAFLRTMAERFGKAMAFIERSGA